MLHLLFLGDCMKELVHFKKGIVTVSSKEVADAFGKTHRDVTRAISLMECSDEFRAANFAHSSYVSEQNKQLDCFDITRDGFSFLCMGFTGKKAGEWKEKYICAFNEMEKALLKLDENSKDSEWLEVRSQSKRIRLQQTDVIKEFVQYATDQGSKSAIKYYNHYTNATYRALHLIQHKKPKLKDTLDMLELSQLMVAENVAKESIKKHMGAGEHYREVFVLVKHDLETLADTLLIGNK